MIVQRRALVEHLRHIYCEGQLGEVVLRGQFACTAFTVDQQLMLDTEGLEGVEPLSAPLGILDLGLLVKTLKAFGEDDNDDLVIEISDHRIEISEEGRGTIRLLTGDPDTVPSTMAPTIREQFLEVLGEGTAVALPQSVVEALVKTHNLLKPANIRVRRTKKAGTVFQVGDDGANYADVVLPRAKPRTKAGEYDLILDAQKLMAVLGQLSDFTASQITFTGEESLVGIWDGAINYILSPQAEG